MNLDPAESDLTPIDTGELVAAVTGRATDAVSATTAAAEITPEDAEKRQSIWWYLLLAGGAAWPLADRRERAICAMQVLVAACEGLSSKVGS